MNIFEFASSLLSQERNFWENEYSKRNKKLIEESKDEQGTLIQEIKREKNLFIFIDTCTWLDHATESDFESLIKIADVNVQRDALLLVPEQLNIEWERHKEEKIIQNELKLIERIINSTKNFAENFVELQSEKDKFDEIITNTENVKNEIAKKVGFQTISIIDQLFTRGIKIPTTESILTKAAQWGLDNHPPFAPKKNSSGDAVLFISIIEYLSQCTTEPTLYFVTNNKTDFSSKDNKTLMHKELIQHAESKNVKIKYYLSLKDALNDIIINVTDDEYVEKYTSEYNASLKKCPKCNEVLTFEYTNWDGQGRKSIYECPKCDFKEISSSYREDEIIDQYY